MGLFYIRFNRNLWGVSMVKYRVKNINNNQAQVVQDEIKTWIESRKHISVVNVNIWSANNTTYSTIIYRENEYQI